MSASSVELQQRNAADTGDGSATMRFVISSEHTGDTNMDPHSPRIVPPSIPGSTPQGQTRALPLITSDATSSRNAKSFDSDGVGESSADEGDDSLRPKQQSGSLVASNSMMAELQARITNARWVVLPGSSFKNLWDVVMIFLLGYVILVLPYRVAFDDSEGIDPVEVAVDILFFVDIVLSFFTAYEDSNGMLILDHKMIAKHYLRTWFFLDVVATFPFYLVGNSAMSRLSAVARVPRLLKLFRLVRLLKLLRAYRFRKYFQQLEYSPSVHPGVVRIVKVLFVMATWSHWCACLFYFVGDLDESNTDSWVLRLFEDDAIVNDAEDRRYVLSFYYAVSTLTSVGFGDITARTNAEIGLSILIMLVGSLYFAYVTATISSIVRSMDEDAATHRRKMDHLRVFLKQWKFPPSLSKRIVREMSSSWKSSTSAHRASREKELLGEMDASLRCEVINSMYAGLIAKSSFFQQFAPSPRTAEFIADILNRGVRRELPAGEMVASYGEPIDQWFLIISGGVRAISSIDHSRVYNKLHKGHVFGDMGLFSTTRKWEASYQARSKLVVLAFPAKLFLHLVSKEYYATQVKCWTDYAARRLDELMAAKRRFGKSRVSSRHLGDLTLHSPGVDEIVHGDADTSSLSPRADANTAATIKQLSLQVERLTQVISGLRQQLDPGGSFEMAPSVTAGSLTAPSPTLLTQRELSVNYDVFTDD